MYTTKERVANSIEFLDKYAATDWRNKIDRETFDILLTDKCPLGFIYGDYNAGVRKLEELSGEFITSGTGGYAFFCYKRDGNKLNREWIKQLTPPKSKFNEFLESLRKELAIDTLEELVKQHPNMRYNTMSYWIEFLKTSPQG